MVARSPAVPLPQHFKYRVVGPVIFRHDAFLTPARRRRHRQFRAGQDLFADPDKIGLRGPAVVPFSRGHGTFTEIPPPYLTKFQLGRVSIPSIEMSPVATRPHLLKVSAPDRDRVQNLVRQETPLRRVP